MIWPFRRRRRDDIELGDRIWPGDVAAGVDDVGDVDVEGYS